MAYCENCSGKGYVTCPGCDGTGKRMEHGVKRACEYCNGTGQAECELCLGSGDDGENG